jgi:hypothetical protein
MIAIHNTTVNPTTKMDAREVERSNPWGMNAWKPCLLLLWSLTYSNSLISDDYVDKFLTAMLTG